MSKYVPKKPEVGEELKMVGGSMDGKLYKKPKPLPAFDTRIINEESPIPLTRSDYEEYSMRYYKGEWVYLCTHNPTGENPVE